MGDFPLHESVVEFIYDYDRSSKSPSPLHPAPERS